MRSTYRANTSYPYDLRSVDKETLSLLNSAKTLFLGVSSLIAACQQTINWLQTQNIALTQEQYNRLKTLVRKVRNMQHALSHDTSEHAQCWHWELGQALADMDKAYSYLLSGQPIRSMGLDDVEKPHNRSNSH